VKTSLKIVHTESHRSWGGQESRVLSECLWMKKNGHRVWLAAPARSQLYARAQVAGLDVWAMGFNNLSAVSDFIGLRRRLRKIAPDVLNTHGNMDAKVGLMAARGLSIPCIVRSRHHSHPVSPSWYNKWMYRYLSHYIFTTAQAVADQIVRDLLVDPAKVVSVASGIVVPTVLTPRETAIRQMQETFALDRDVRFVGSVAMLRDWKGHRYLVEAFGAISAAFPRHHLVIVGDGDEMAALNRQGESCGLTGRIHFTGFRDDPWPCFRAFDLNVLASTKNEGIPQVLLQAMVAGCPVIGTRVGGIPDIVDDGLNGWLVAPSDATALAGAMSAILIDPQKAQERARRASRYVADHYTIDAMGRRILDLYGRVITNVQS
jgi:glycosyltransferase involved in cell wall biosynthesis